MGPANGVSSFTWVASTADTLPFIITVCVCMHSIRAYVYMRRVFHIMIIRKKIKYERLIIRARARIDNVYNIYYVIIILFARDFFPFCVRRRGRRLLLRPRLLNYAQHRYIMHVPIEIRGPEKNSGRSDATAAV